MSNKTIKIGVKQLFEFVLFIVIISVLYLFDADVWMVFSVGIIAIMFFLCLKDVNGNSFFFFFLVSFFIYLMSGDIAELFFDRHYHLQFTKEAVIHAHKCIFISLTAIWGGYVFTSIKKKKSIAVISEKKEINKDILLQIKYVAKLAFFLSLSILLIHTLDTVRFVASYGYIAYYTSYEPMLPSVIVQIGEYAPLALCAYLATFPSKKETALVIKLYIVYAILALFIGARGALVYNVIFILCYCFYRNYTDKGKSIWISKRMIIILLAVVPFALSFLFLYEYIRTGRQVEFESFGETIVDFFVNIGSASQNIKYGYVYRNEIPENRFYSLGGTLNYFKYGTLFNLSDLDSIPSRHSVEFALHSHSFDAMLSYLTIRTQFLNGQGCGSSFIAELFADCGYIGVAIGSVIYGWLFKKMSYISNKNWLSSTIKLYVFFTMLSAPRATYDGFIASILNVNNVLFVLVIYFVAWTFRNRSKVSIHNDVNI